MPALQVPQVELYWGPSAVFIFDSGGSNAFQTLLVVVLPSRDNYGLFSDHGDHRGHSDGYVGRGRSEYESYCGSESDRSLPFHHDEPEWQLRVLSAAGRELRHYRGEHRIQEKYSHRHSPAGKSGRTGGCCARGGSSY